ncbi:MAG TPA: hypothetical protein VGW76_14270 [Pyrinomonadaceae bacterium]|nr:hypothetical protein [Pyrinomonadaceae bacterium]
MELETGVPLRGIEIADQSIEKTAVNGYNAATLIVLGLALGISKNGKRK